MKTRVAAACLVLAGACACRGALSFTGSYSQDFDSLASAGTGNAWANDSTLSGWFLFDKNGTGITTYDAGTGTSTTGKFYSFGSSGSSDRAFGGVGSGGTYFGSPASGAVAGWIALAVKNTSGSGYSGFVLQWDGEQWRDGGATTPVAQTMVLQYGFGDTFSSVTWSTPGGNFDFTSPVFSNTGSGAAVDGNNAGKVSGLGGTISSISWQNDQTLWLRWIENNDVGNDHGLAIDSFSITAVPEPAEWGLYSAIGLLGIGSVRLWRQQRAAKAASA